ncbi:MAG: hypothetical protein ACRELA_24925 [Candidatus Rokuibacteriota bacterium]
MHLGVRTRGQRIRSAAFRYVNIVPFVLFALFPFYYMVITSLKNDAELYNLKAVPFLIETGVITDHHRYLFFKTEFLTWMTNSFIISVVSTSVSQRPVRAVRAHDEIAHVDRPPAEAGRRGHRRRQQRGPPRRERPRIAAHEDAAEVVPAPELVERDRAGVEHRAARPRARRSTRADGATPS